MAGLEFRFYDLYMESCIDLYFEVATFSRITCTRSQSISRATLNTPEVLLANKVHEHLNNMSKTR